MTNVTLGVFKGVTSFGKPIRSGGAALIVDDGDDQLIIAVAEERVTGIKYAGGYEAALDSILKSARLSLEDVTRAAVSSCCEPRWCAAADHLLAGDERLTTVGHHESHATQAFLGPDSGVHSS